MSERRMSVGDRRQSEENEALLREVESVVEDEGENYAIRTKCSMCGAIGEFPPEGLRLVSLETTRYRLQFSFEFFCLKCHEMDEQVLGEAVWLKLLDAGVPVRVVCEVDECGEIWVRREEPALTGMEVDGWLTELRELHELPAELLEVDDNERSQ